MSINIDMKGDCDIFRNYGMDSNDDADATKLSDINGFSLALTSSAASDTERAARAKGLRSQPTNNNQE
jgi:hypothetical protein